MKSTALLLDNGGQKLNSQHEVCTMAWQHVQSGNITNYHPGNAKQGVTDYIHVPDAPVYRSRKHTGMPDTFAAGQALGADPRFRRFMLWCFVFVAGALVLFVAVGMVEMGWDRLMKWDVARNKGKPTIWSAQTLNWSSRLFHSNGQAVEVGGPDAFVNGNVDGLKLDAFSNLTIRGDVTNSRLTAYDTITVGNVSNSTLTAHKIVVTGKAMNVKRIVLRPYEGIPLSKRPHSVVRPYAQK